MATQDIPHYTSAKRSTLSGGIVYLITHTPTGKQYIGMTRRTLEKRWQEHVYEAFARTDTHDLCLHAALRTFPLDTFTREIVDTGKSRNELRRKEEAWIIGLHTEVPHGFNLRYRELL